MSELKMEEKSFASAPAQATGTHDPLLTSLVWLTKHYHKPFSAKALTAGLPLAERGLTPALFVRAAERAQLNAEVKKQLLHKLSPDRLPVVLLLQDGQVCILLKLLPNQGAQIVSPAHGMSIIEVSLEKLEKQYTGSAIFIASRYEFTERSDETIKQPSMRNWFWRVIVRIWPLYTEVLVASLLINLFALVSPLFVMNVYDRVVPNHAVETLWVLAIGVSIVFVFDFIMRLLRSYFIDLASKNVDLRLSASIFEQILGIKMMARPGSVGAFANTIQSFEAFREFITSSTATVLIDLPFVFIFIAIIALIGGTLALIPVIMVPLVILIGWLVQIPLTALTREAYRYANEKQATLIESLGGVETIKSIGAESPMQHRWEQVNQLSAKLGIKLRFFSNLNVYFSLFAQQLSYVVVIIWGVYKITHGDMTTGGLIACSILTSRALAPMSQVAALLTRYYQSMHSLSSLNMVMSMPVERPHGKTFLHRPVLHGTIEFRQVSFQYPQQDVPVLKNISFKISPGERVGIIGRIGSGKTTIAKMILGLYQPTAGTILMDNIEQHQIDLAELRHNMGYVPQDVTLFYGSVKENIIFGAPYVNDDAIIRAANVAGVNQFVNTHPHGFDLQVGERGIYLSGGQRQAVAIARAFLLDPPIIVMDEPSNSMDDKTEANLKNSLGNYLTEKTLILVTHKSSLLSLVNRLIILEAGQLVADGPKEEVIKALAEGKIKAPRL